MTDPMENSVLDTYERHGQAWASLRSCNLVEGIWLNRFCDLLPTGSAVLDIGCGSGVPIARELLQRGFIVTGVDGSSTMLALFRKNLPETPWVLMDMRRLALDQRFAGLLAWDSFFHLSPDDQRGMFARFKAHALPGAALMFTSGITEGSKVGELEGDPLYHGSLGYDEYRASLEMVGFEVVDHVANDATCGNRNVWLARNTN